MSTLSRGGGDDNNNIAVYDQIPIKSYSKDMTPSSSYSLSRRGFQPNFHSDVYKEQAKESF